jgi:recombination protein RecR
MTRLVTELRRMPGVGQRTAERLAFHLVVAPKGEALALADAIRDVKENARPCSSCFDVTESDPCAICSDPARDGSVICVVERPRDVLAIEKLGTFKGLYHVLLGSISLLEGVEAKDLTIAPLVERVKKSKGVPSERSERGTRARRPEGGSPDSLGDGGGAQSPPHEAVREVMLATNPTFDGDATALHLRAALEKLGVRVTRIARGLPSGSSLEVASKAILAEAIEARRDF